VRLTGKLVLVFVAVVAVVLGGGAWLQIQHEDEMVAADLQRDAAFAARILAHDVGATWARQDRAAALSLLQDPALAAEDVQARWVDDVASGPPGLAWRSQPVSVRTRHAIETWVAVATPDGTGAVVVVQSLDSLRARAASTVRRTVITTAILATVVAVASALLGTVLVGRPTRALVANTRRIGAGDLSGRLDLRQRDELGEIARAVDAMVVRLEEARDRARDETERRVAAVAQLRHADRLMTVGKLASGLAHELGTPMNVVAGRAQMIMSGEVEGEQVVASAGVIVEQTRRMTAIIRQLLDFARRTPSDRRHQHVAGLVVNVTTLLQAMARAAQVELTTTTQPVEADLDAAQIEQVVTNLVVNALHACTPGDRVDVEVAAVIAAPPDGPAQPCARIRVTDTGCGMDEATRARMFEPFFTTKDVGAGTGLGLSVVWGIVAEHGGWIDVSSARGEGTRVDVLIPSGAEQAA